jgi:hypothetical protein
MLLLVLIVLYYHMNDSHLGVRYHITVLFHKWTDRYAYHEVRSKGNTVYVAHTVSPWLSGGPDSNPSEVSKIYVKSNTLAYLLFQANVHTSCVLQLLTIFTIE